MILPISLLLLLLAWPVTANTEIVNFRGSQHDDLSLDDISWPRVDYNTPRDRVWSLTPTNDEANAAAWMTSFRFETSSNQLPAHALLVVLDLDSFPVQPFWDSDMFTARLSWPAWYPVDFNVRVYNAKELSLQFPATSPPPSTNRSTRTHYALIQAKAAGVHRNESHSPEAVQFHLTVEKLLLGAVPPSVLPVVVAILAALIPSYFAARFLMSFLSPLLQMSEHELKSTTTLNKDD